MDLGTLGGIGLVFGSLVFSMIMEGSSPGALFIIPAMLLVLGGTIGTAFASGLMKDGISIVHWTKVALLSPTPKADDVVSTLVRLAETARRDGLLALEDATKQLGDPFLRRGLGLAIDGMDSEELRDILEAEIAAKAAHDRQGAKLFNNMGGFAPTLGIIGTVVGLVHVLENLSTPEKLGHLIAGAFVATLWGVLTANALWLPMANKISRVSGVEIQHMEVVVEGIISIQSGTNPRVLQQKLVAYLPASDAVKDQVAA